MCFESGFPVTGVGSAPMTSGPYRPASSHVGRFAFTANSSRLVLTPTQYVGQAVCGAISPGRGLRNGVKPLVLDGGICRPCDFALAIQPFQGVVYRNHRACILFQVEPGREEFVSNFSRRHGNGPSLEG